ncbi:hypothetical protein [Methanoplanus limicola]|uniref:Uncharacterized protein n=1 Tax=Methanoplanus limicola DSM 2279 TaxID=937775 RepID=H1YZK0_9EURY|nr:hypothetical protein [Methanoplanus limicola]EHQ36109.1 hypothetical protein Metlim_2023 [Methanoplanus limicola DSM 2279]
MFQTAILISCNLKDSGNVGHNSILQDGLFSGMGACTKAAVIVVLISLMVLLSGCMGEDAAKESKASTALAEERLLHPEYLPYSLLVSDPGRYSGEIIHITGKITEISADNTGYNILVSTDKQENGDYSGDIYSVLLSFASGSVSVGEIVDIKGEFIGTGGSSGSPEIKSQVFSSVYDHGSRKPTTLVVG